MQFDISRKIISTVTEEGWRTIPHVCFTYEADVEHIMMVLDDHKKQGEHISFNSAMFAIIADGLKAAPNMNAVTRFNGLFARGELHICRHINVTMPVVYGSKMISLNVRHIENRSAQEISRQIDDMMRRLKNTNLEEVLYDVSRREKLKGLKELKLIDTACKFAGYYMDQCDRTRLHGKEKAAYYSISERDRLTYRDFEKGTITISNPGAISKEIRGFTSILEIVPPQVCAISLGSIRKTTIIDENDNIQICRVVPVTIAFDHRFLDMKDILPFVRRMEKLMTEWDAG